MIIKPDKWYLINTDTDRKHFIYQAKYQFGSQCNNDYNIDKAQCLKYNSKTNTINYRSIYNPQYCHCYEVYKSEDNKMTPDYPHYEDRAICKRDPILENYYDESRTKLEKEYLENRHKAILETSLGKAAQQYIREIMMVSNHAPELEALIPDDCLPITTRKYFDELANELNNKVTELSKKCEEIKYLLSIADTFEQKEAIYIKYGLLQKEESTTMKSLKVKVK